MTNKQMIDVLSTYSELLKKEGHKFERNGDAKEREARLNHALWMCRETINFVREEKLDKANRWMGFIQGVLWTYNIYSVDEMRDHNR